MTCFLISLKAGGVGLNLTAADYVIHMDPWWNPAAEDQASDRAHRIGQTRPVTIYRLVTKGTIEEQVVALHHHKRDLAERLLEGRGRPGAPRCRGAAGPPEKNPSPDPVRGPPPRARTGARASTARGGRIRSAPVLKRPARTNSRSLPHRRSERLPICSDFFSRERPRRVTSGERT